MNKNLERRKSERIEHKSALLHSTDPPDFFYHGTMHNYSKGGLYFESDQDLLAGNVISISIKEPPAEFMKQSDQYFDVRIMWCRVLQGTSYQVGYGAMLI